MSLYTRRLSSFKRASAVDVSSELFVTVENGEQLGLEVAVECRNFVMRSNVRRLFHMSLDGQRRTLAFGGKVDCAEPRDHRALQTADRYESRRLTPEQACLRSMNKHAQVTCNLWHINEVVSGRTGLVRHVGL